MRLIMGSGLNASAGLRGNVNISAAVGVSWNTSSSSTVLTKI